MGETWRLGLGGRPSRHAAIRPLAVAILLSSATAGLAGDSHVGPVIHFFNANVRKWMSDPLIIAALKEQNRINGALSAADINALDTEWRNELDGPRQPLIDKVLAAPLSGFLKEKEEEASGSITEIFVMDARGLNAGQSGVTSDYWQGDEDKFQKSFEAGPEAVFVDSAKKDESTQMLQSQVSMTIVDEANRPIGAITVGVNLDQL